MIESGCVKKVEESKKEIPAKIELLQRMIAKAEKEVNTLADRLNSVRRQEPETSKDTAQRCGLTPLGDTLVLGIDQLVTVVETLITLNNTLEI